MTATDQLVRRHVERFNARDLEGILSDYAADAVLFTPTGPLRGRDAIRGFFTTLLAEFSKPGSTFTLDEQHVDRDYAYILWRACTADNHYELGTDTFFVRDGEIAVQSFAGKVTPLN